MECPSGSGSGATAPRVLAHLCDDALTEVANGIDGGRVARYDEADDDPVDAEWRDRFDTTHERGVVETRRAGDAALERHVGDIERIGALESRPLRVQVSQPRARTGAWLWVGRAGA